MISVLIPVMASLCASPPVSQEAADRDFDALVTPQNRPEEAPTSLDVSPWSSDRTEHAAAQVEVPVERFAALWQRVRLLAKKRKQWRREGPAIVMGSAHYTGRAVNGALELTLRLRVGLARKGRWKTVPLAGQGAVLVSATVDDEPIGVTTSHGYHVWLTRRTGEVEIVLSLLVPSRGPRGSIEYDVRIARTPVTRIACRFPTAGLEPQLDSALETEVTSAEGATQLSATLRPTTRLHMVGFRDLGATATEKARVTADTMGLLSVDEGSVELFSVVRYTILYAGTRTFPLRIPAGATVVSAEGSGAFRYNVRSDGDASILDGEVAHAMRGVYELSVRVRMPLPADGQPFEVPLPQPVGCEREAGWLAVEVPGRLRLTEGELSSVRPTDTRQLPPELVRSAVTPILRSYRYHSPSRRLSLRAERLPEQDVSSAAVDRVRAFTVVSAEGGVLTEMRLTLRNRLRHSLALDVARSAKVRSVLLDGRPVRPSRREDGRLMLPLERSAGNAWLVSFTVHLVLEDTLDPLGWIGSSRLRLPAVDMPIRSLAWSVFLPESNVYGALRGDGGGQRRTGSLDWRRPARDEQASVPPPTGIGGSAATGVDGGVMPVRIDLPKDGLRLDHERYWLPADRPVEVSFRYARASLKLPGRAAFAVLLVLAFWLVLVRRRWAVWPGRIAGLALGAAAVWGLGALDGAAWLRWTVLVSLVLVGLRWSWARRAYAATRRGFRELVRLWREPRPEHVSWSPRLLVWRGLAGLGLSFGLYATALLAVELYRLLLHPLAG